MLKWLTSPSKTPSPPPPSSGSPSPSVSAESSPRRNSHFEAPGLRSASPSRLAALATKLFSNGGGSGNGLSPSGLGHSASTSSSTSSSSSSSSSQFQPRNSLDLQRSPSPSATPPPPSKTGSLPVVSRVSVTTSSSVLVSQSQSQSHSDSEDSPLTPSTSNSTSSLANNDDALSATSTSTSTSAQSNNINQSNTSTTPQLAQRFSFSSIPQRILSPISNLIRATPTPPPNDSDDSDVEDDSNPVVVVVSPPEEDTTTVSHIPPASVPSLFRSPLANVVYTNDGSDDLGSDSPSPSAAVEEENVLPTPDCSPASPDELLSSEEPVIETSGDLADSSLNHKDNTVIIISTEDSAVQSSDSIGTVIVDPVVLIDGDEAALPLKQIDSAIIEATVSDAPSVDSSEYLSDAIEAPTDNIVHILSTNGPLITPLESSVEVDSVASLLEDTTIISANNSVPRLESASADASATTTSTKDEPTIESNSTNDKLIESLQDAMTTTISPIIASAAEPTSATQTNVIPKLQFRPKPTPQERQTLTANILSLCRPLFFPTPLPPYSEQPQKEDPMTLSIASEISTTTSVSLVTVPDQPCSKRFKREELGPVLSTCNLPRHLAFAVHKRILESHPSSNPEDAKTIGWDQFHRFMVGVYQHIYPDTDAFTFEVLKANGDRNWVCDDDFRIIVEDVLSTHTAFEFLASSPAFQARFTETVISRLLYLTPRHGRNRLTLRDIRTSHIASLLINLESATNSLGASIPSVFSYKDFYVIYCKFWELDRDRDMVLTIYDLELYGRRALSHAALARIVECFGVNVDAGEVAGHAAGTAGETVRCLGYKEFIAFILSVEDKTTDSALEYWFRILDLDGDGVLSLLELETFWEHQHMRLPEQYSVFDFFSMILDLIRPHATSLTLMDLKRNRHASGLFLDLLLDSRKHVENIRRSTDVGFRMRDEVWTEEEVSSTSSAETKRKEEDDGSGIGGGFEVVMDLENVVKRYKLQGWSKFSEKAYRELSAPAEVDSADEGEVTDDEDQVAAAAAVASVDTVDGLADKKLADV
ncbi:hypothetical protein HDU79_002441 [Rhizoclosmatium sp. JEL0117]|nr:hypothetical protein HDU79_002441 [Rhizoclosmatium sp. JEL0117]